ncbi:MAG: NAD-dependent epimerase/dehydratase family protein [Eubacterium sp.]|nr:NAD-dependent epimerase/dehydratase family protein [Eubacterium sp.]
MRADYKSLKNNKRILITGCAGFIGYHLSASLLEYGCYVIGIDNLNSYYDIRLKKARLELLKKYQQFKFLKFGLENKQDMEQLFFQEKPEIVVNLAAQAGVRYSISHPDSYIQSNLIGFYNILECCRKYPVEHLIYASSSSVYGANEKVPFSVEDKTDHPVSLYAATKKSNELMAYCYSRLYGLPATGLRFFTVYGPWGRPDMAYFKFAGRIMHGVPIQIYNNGNMLRDFTYIDDIVKGLMHVIPNAPLEEEGAKHKVYNIGNNKPEKLMDFIAVLEKCLGMKAQLEYLPMQQGDVYQTYADCSNLFLDFGFKPGTEITEGLSKFSEWFQAYDTGGIYL